MKKIMEQQRERKRKQREKERFQAQQKEANKNKYDYASEKEFIQATKQFDILNEQLTYRRCTCCRRVRLDMKVEQQSFGSTKYSLCYSCKNYSLNEIKQVQRALPVWKNDRQEIQFQLPKELKNLREGEN